MRDFSVVQLGPRQLEAGCLDTRRGVFDEEDRLTVCGNPVRFREDETVAMRVDEMTVDPVGARTGQLADIQLPGRDENLSQISVDVVTIYVRVMEHVVLPERLELGDGV